MPSTYNGKAVGNGFGLMGFTWRPNPTEPDKAIKVMKAALEAGCNVWNGGEFYGPIDGYNSLVLLNKYFEKYPEDADKVIINIKGATRIEGHPKPDGSPAYVRQSVEHSLSQLGPRGKIDIFECARRDKTVPFADTLGELVKLREQGKIGGIALSEVAAETIREAVKITKIVAVEIELSLFWTEPMRNGVLEACREFGIPIHAYSPIGKGFLTGQIKSPDDFEEGDFRRIIPAFQGENFDTNMKLVRAVQELASKKGCTPAQLALGWLRTLSKRDDMPEIIPIPGATTVERVKENAVVVDLTEEDMKAIDKVLSEFKVAGDRYPEHIKHLLNT